MVAVVATSVSAPCADASSAAPSSYVERIWERLSEGDGFGLAVEKAGLTSLSADDVPDWMGELCDFRMLAGAYANEDLSIVGWSQGGVAHEMASSLREGLAERGWMERGSGQHDLFFYEKSEGRCRWVMAKVSEAGDAVSVVLHIRHT